MSAEEVGVGAAVVNQQRLWSIQDVSDYLGVPVATIYGWRVRSEGPPAMRMGRHLRYDPTSVAEWAREQEDSRHGPLEHGPRDR